MPGSKTGGSVADWQPSVKYLLCLVLAEILIFGLIRTFSNHGG
jgi:hypothetical protein